MAGSILLTTADVAVILGCSVDAIHKHAAAGNIGRKVGGAYFFNRKEVDRLRKRIGKPGWKPGRSRKGQGAGRKWTEEQRANFAATMAERSQESSPASSGNV